VKSCAKRSKKASARIETPVALPSWLESSVSPTPVM
jgi:hypothetical protein